jgi:nucleotide-binding universal stress UspA family protein
MYKTILLALEGISSDRFIVEHVKLLAKFTQSRVVLFHVERWVAHIHSQGVLYPGARDDIEYLRKIKSEFQSAGILAEFELAYGDPAMEIVKRVQKGCDLVAMNRQSHRSLAEIFFGTIASRVQDRINAPVLLLRATQMAAK